MYTLLDAACCVASVSRKINTQDIISVGIHRAKVCTRTKSGTIDIRLKGDIIISIRADNISCRLPLRGGPFKMSYWTWQDARRARARERARAKARTRTRERDVVSTGRLFVLESLRKKIKRRRLVDIDRRPLRTWTAFSRPGFFFLSIYTSDTKQVGVYIYKIIILFIECWRIV